MSGITLDLEMTLVFSFPLYAFDLVVCHYTVMRYIMMFQSMMVCIYGGGIPYRIGM